MQLDLDKFIELSYAVGNTQIVNEMVHISPMLPFSEEAIDFFDDLSKLLIKNGKGYSDVATFGFWCRRAALLREKAKYDDIHLRIGKGIVFHSTPSNVPVNFAFSFAAGLLAGNSNIVRLPAKPFTQVQIICDAVNELLEGAHERMRPYLCMVKYPPIQALSDVFSDICDIRAVWGGDGTINEMRKSSLKPRATEINFADRHSIAVINGDRYLQAEDKNSIAQRFYNDTYFSDQNACTAPRIIIWLGQNKEEAKHIFWESIHTKVKDSYKLAPVQAIGKLTAFYRMAAVKDVELIQGKDNLITRIHINTLDKELMTYKYNSGFFMEYDAQSLEEIAPLCTERCQTLTYFGLDKEEITAFFVNVRPHGVDRVIPMGQSMDFTLVWDGFDLIRCMSRKVTVL